MASARFRRDPRGDLYLFLSGTVDGERIQIRKRVKDNDEALAQRAVLAHEARFLVGDLSELRKAKDERSRRPQPARQKRTVRRGESLETWRDTWLDSIKGTIGEGAWRTLRSSLLAVVEMVGGDRALEDLRPGDLITLRADLVRSKLARVTVDRRIADLRRLLMAATLAERVGVNPFAATLRVRRTKLERADARETLDASLPLSVEELNRFLEVCRNPRVDQPLEVNWFPLSEALVLTGLRYGEVAGLRWPEVDRTGKCVRICHALEHYNPTANAPTKTGASWTIPLRPPLRELLARQRERVFLRDPEGWVFPTEHGKPPSYHNWRSRIWPTLLRRSKITLSRPGDAQKLLRKLFITNSLVCGRNPKRVSSEVGHANLRMITDYYERYIDPSNWPTPQETGSLIDLYGFEDVQRPAHNSEAKEAKA
jgi:integrase